MMEAGQIMAYRTPGERAVTMCATQIKRVRVGAGIVERPSGSGCPTPGWWRRFLGDVELGDVWVCSACGQRWRSEITAEWHYWRRI